MDTLAPRRSLHTGGVAERDRATEWLGLIGELKGRRTVSLAAETLARGEAWVAVAAWVRWEGTPRAIAYRYRTALAKALCPINGCSERWARALAIAH